MERSISAGTVRLCAQKRLNEEPRRASCLAGVYALLPVFRFIVLRVFDGASLGGVSALSSELSKRLCKVNLGEAE